MSKMKVKDLKVLLESYDDNSEIEIEIYDAATDWQKMKRIQYWTFPRNQRKSDEGAKNRIQVQDFVRTPLPTFSVCSYLHFDYASFRQGRTKGRNETEKDVRIVHALV